MSRDKPCTQSAIRNKKLDARCKNRAVPCMQSDFEKFVKYVARQIGIEKQ